DIATNFVERLMTYALGRGLEPEDSCAVKQIVADAAESDYQLSSLVTGVVLSKPFRTGAVAPADHEGSDLP
ncbi:MAG: DUF1585 domain-containing protein, partial [Planctomycetota bacterium]